MDTHHRLRACRESMGLSQRAMAEKLGCSQVFVGMLESGKKRPGLATALAIRDVSAAWDHGPIPPEEWVKQPEASAPEAA